MENAPGDSRCLCRARDFGLEQADAAGPFRDVALARDAFGRQANTSHGGKHCTFIRVCQHWSLVAVAVQPDTEAAAEMRSVRQATEKNRPSGLRPVGASFSRTMRTTQSKQPLFLLAIPAIHSSETSDLWIPGGCL